MHNVRCKWIRLTAPHLKVPAQLNRTHCTPQQARAGLAESAARCAEMLAEALGGGEGRDREISQGRLGSALAGWRGNAVLHACSRGPPSRAGMYARASARIPLAKRGCVRDLELGKAMEGVWIASRPGLHFVRMFKCRAAARHPAWAVAGFSMRSTASAAFHWERLSQRQNAFRIDSKLERHF